MKIKELTFELNTNICLITNQESYDNCGLIVGNPEEEITGVLTTLDINSEVVEEAIQKNCNLIIAHHPIIFRGLKTLLSSNSNEKTIMLAVKNGISIYAAHTSLDNRFDKSINKTLAEKIGLTNLQPLKCVNGDMVKYINGDISTTPFYGAGAVGILEKPEFVVDFIHSLKKKLGIGGVIRFSDTHKNALITKVAICTGAGFFMSKEAKKMGAELFITSDLTYHNFFDEKEIVLADIGHYESEKHSSTIISNLVKEYFKDRVFVSEIDTNPVAYTF